MPNLRPAAWPMLAALLLASCGDKNLKVKEFEPDIFVTNQGQFRTPNGSVSAKERRSQNSEKDPFQRVNSRPLGDVVQSMTIADNKGYIVVNNSNKVEVVSLPGFASVGTISGVAQPRYMTVLSPAKAFLTEWVATGQAGRVAVIDPNTNTVSSTIAVGRNPERPLLLNGKLYVPNADENTVTVINAGTNQVEATLTLSDGPNSLAADASGNLWVLCSGITRYGSQPPYPVLSSTPAKLVRLNPANPNGGRLELDFASGGATDLYASPNRQQLYYRYAGAVYRLEASATSLPTTPFIRRRFNGIGIDPADGTLYGGVGGFTTDGRAIHYSATGAPIDSFAVGIGPSGFAFR